MTAEDSKKCCFGFIDPRCGTKIIATFNIVVFFIAILSKILMLSIKLGSQARLLPSSKCNDAEETTTKIVNYIDGLCASSLIKIILLRFDLRLKKSIYEQNVQNIEHWLVIHLMVLIHIIIFYISVAFLSDRPLYFLGIGLIFSLIELSMMHVVQCFYHAELKNLVPRNTKDDNNVTPSQSA